ncbi:MAG: M18 family aminopeptidase [Bacteroidales bacterium]
MEKQFAKDLISFLDESPSSYHAVESVKKRLLADGFKELFPNDSWEISQGGKYYTTKNDSAIFAFVIGQDKPCESGFNIICAHTDSPSFKIKPNCEMAVEGRYLKLNTEVYGGPILYTWFDRPLTLAGRVLLKSENILRPSSKLIFIDRPILIIPHLAIHLNRSVNDGIAISRQKDMLPVISLINEQFEKNNFLVNLIAKELNVEASDILDFDLTLREHAKGQLVGLNQELISAGCIDDLAMAHAGVNALLDSNDSTHTKVLALFDNEEVGSGSKQGAASPLLRNILERVVISLGGSKQEFFQAISQSFMISADMAHALHPNYPEKHDPTNHPLMNGGPVIKLAANQKYISDGDSSAVFKSICEKAGVPCQTFVNHSDMVGGSTLGNLLLTQMDLRGVDIGNPMWGMHSIRETAGVTDHSYMRRALTTFYSL